MAGIGFHLRKLASEDNLSGLLRAYLHSAVVAAGPWILLVISITLITTFTKYIVGLKEVDEFLSIIIYNFFFSFIFSAPLYMISARYVSDCLYQRTLAPVPGIMISSLGILLMVMVPLAIVFYTLYVRMSPFSTLLSIVNFTLLCEMWLTMLYLSALRDFRAITSSWVLGTLLGIFLSVTWGKSYGTSGLLLGLDLGLLFILASIKAHVLAEYPFSFRKAKEFRFYFRNYKLLFFSGFFLFSGMCIDRIVMWMAPEAMVHANHLRTYPVYDGATFLSYLSIIPSLALFVFSLETNFYDSYISYIQHIERNAPFNLLEEERRSIVDKMLANGRAFLVLQGSLTLSLLFLAPLVFDWLGIGFMQLSIFRLGLIGAFFSALNLCIVIIFSYFDSQSNMLLVTVLMFVMNALLSFITLKCGFAYYGYGYCLAMILTFLVGGVRLFLFLNNLHYHIFITNVVKKQNFEKLDFS
ncbi:MAG: exopolysaccharide Pel transporter PelG [Verrucomicrobia bacterium]|nr:exopolysaccharide Pel transporter PelG [Verrucomicrobiota bacterium]MBS0646747.1 exopolysaccharide Pel transporter PelG [Verrucomicrobiota bacterium]